MTHNVFRLARKHRPDSDVASAESVRLEYAVPGPTGQLGYVLVAPPERLLEGAIVEAIPTCCRCRLHERDGWWVSPQDLGRLAALLDLHGLSAELWVRRDL
jgi:hypothetical protein